MKKICVLTLCLVLLASTAMAGTMPLELVKLSDTLNLVYELPEGVKSADVSDVYDMKVVSYEMEDETMPTYMLVISYSEPLHEKDIKDLSDEEIEALVAYTAMDSEGYTYEVIEMEDGWPAVLIDFEGESDWVDAFTVINGYLVQLHGYHEDFAPLTDAENAFALQLLDGANIVEAE